MTPNQPASLNKLLSGGDPAGLAIGAPGQTWTTRQTLSALCNETGHFLNRFGLGRNDRIAIVLPNGPVMATAFLAIGAHATTAPLNPAYKESEFAFYLADLDAKALILAQGVDSPARAAAGSHGIPVIELTPDGSSAGRFTLAPGALQPATARSPGPALPADIALVLHTSGTTARPKIVPLSQTNILASAANIAATLRLTPADRCLNIMPLFHIHGLIAAVLASLAAGGAIACAPGLNVTKFFPWMSEVRPSWYTAVPSMHQSIMKFAPRFSDIVVANSLRFIRSSSASLPPQVMTDLETLFKVPVIEAYGMTEAAHQMTSNQLPPHPRFAGSVGIAAGPDIAIMAADGRLLPARATGEVVIRGANVTAGYENNPAANETAFCKGWFRTGDQGVIDAHGFLRLTGRLKEQINRGGEKISPLEIDNILMEHPAVQQAVTFALPDKDYGEAVAAAIVLRDGAAADEKSIRAFAGKHLAGYKVPAKIIFLDEIPKGATGKLQRIGLAETLGLIVPAA